MSTVIDRIKRRLNTQSYTSLSEKKMLEMTLRKLEEERLLVLAGENPRVDQIGLICPG
jgi:phosphoenolpyruvate carboxylase